MSLDRRGWGVRISLPLIILTSPALWAADPADPVLPQPRPIPQPQRIGPPPWLPRYDLDIQLDVAGHQARVRQRVTWTNRHARPTKELVFNAHSYFKVPDKDIGFAAKTLELLRIDPQDGLDAQGHCLQIQQVSLGAGDAPLNASAQLPFHYEGDTNTDLVIPLPQPVLQGQTAVVVIDFVMRLPQKQGRWGQWQGVTFLSNWLPVLACYDDNGWHPTPFIPWHQPFMNEAGVYNVRVTLPADQKIACSGTILKRHELDDGLQQVDVTANGVREFTFLCSARYQEHVDETDSGPGTPKIRVHCLALPEHEHHAKIMLRTACEVIPAYGKWIGPYPYPDYTIAESFFGWNGNECSTLVMIDVRIFALPHVAGRFVEYLLTHETCHQWFYNLIGTNGYRETWMDEAWATYFSHRYLDEKYGRNNSLIQFPRGLGWLPTIRRETYRNYTFCGVMGRGNVTPIIADMPSFSHIVNLFGLCYDKGSKVVGMIVDRLGDVAFLDFMHRIYGRYRYGILRVDDLKRELEEYQGRSWDAFFQRWLYGVGISDWSIEKVTVEPVNEDSSARRWRIVPQPFLDALRGDSESEPYRATVILHQKADFDEQTVLGFSFDQSKDPEKFSYSVRVPILPDGATMNLDEPPTRIEVLPDHRVRVEVVLPKRPVQIAVDPDQILVDRDPDNNYWKPRVRFQVTPLYTMLNETDMTTDYDKWNVNIGPWTYGATYNDAWYTRSTMFGVRAGAYRTQQFYGGVYSAYRSSYRDVIMGADGLWDHLPLPNTQIGFNFERRLASFLSSDANPDRGVVYGRYIFQYTSSLYKRPMHFVETFVDAQQNFLPFPIQQAPGAERYNYTTMGGLHYHINYLTPYWNPMAGFQFDATVAAGVVGLQSQQGAQQVNAQFSTVKTLPDLSDWVDEDSWFGGTLGSGLRWLGDNRVAFRVMGAAGLPDQGQYFTLGGDTMFRAFSMAQRQGSMIWLSSIEWRIPLILRADWDVCDHVAGLRNLYAALFYDVGNAYVELRPLGAIAQGVGLGLRCDVAWFSFVERTTFRLDVARTVNGSTPTQVWFGIQQPF